MKTKTPISYAPIPGPNGGRIALEIYPPGAFVGLKRGYEAFIGGCGVDRAPTLAEARGRLLAAAVDDLRRRVAEHRRLADHYHRELARLQAYGLKKKRTRP